MALCIRVEATADSIATAFAKNDLVLKAIAAGDKDDPVRAIGTGDDYYTAPFAIVPMKRRKSMHNPDPRAFHWLVFSSYKVREAHHVAVKAMKDHGRGIVLVGSVTRIEHGELTGVKVARDKWVQVRESAWAGGDDVCTKLEDHAFKAACEALGVAAGTIPADWRALRTAKLEAMCADLKNANTRLADAPLATLPVWGTVPFAVKSSAGRAEAEAQAAAVRAEGARLEKKRKQESAELHLQAKKARYAPTIAKALELEASGSVPDGQVCVAIFDSKPDGEAGPFQCPYDRKDGSIFCSMCQTMAEKLGES